MSEIERLQALLDAAMEDYTEARAEIERMREAGRRFDDLTAQRIKDLEARLRMREADYRALEDEACDLETRLAKVVEALRLIHVTCAAYPIECPDCHYRWAAGLLRLSKMCSDSLAAAQPKEEK